MSQQEQHSAYPFNTRIPVAITKRQEDSSTTFVKPLHEGSSQPFTPYPYTEEDIPPPPVLATSAIH